VVVICPQAIRMAITCVSINSFTVSPDQIPFLLSQATPHSVRLAGPQGKRQAISPDQALCADLFCLGHLLDRRARRRHGKEQLGIAGLAGGSGPPVRSRIAHAYPPKAGFLGSSH
jgi:hypothetical protein